MFHKLKLLSAPMAPLLAGLGIAGAAMGAGTAESGSEAVRCAIQAHSNRGMVTLEGVVEADVAVSGSYRIRVVSAGRGGSTNIQQGGRFDAGPDEAVTLGRVTLGGTGADHEATLTITANGRTIACGERVGGPI